MVKHLLYIIYLIEWKLSHKGKGFKGCTPACFDEWCDCELREMMDNPSWYEGLWYYPLVEYLREKRSTTF